MHRYIRLVIQATLLLSLSSALLPAEDFTLFGERFDIHGFFSQGYMKSDGNNFVTANTGAGTFQMTDGAINLATNVNDKLHIGVQVYDRYVGQLGKGQVQVDWAYADYHWKDWFGLRAGKIKTALGLYNDTQDVDVLHTWALLPQSIYPVDLRSVNIAQTGGAGYGDVPMSSKLGTVTWQVYGGIRPFDWRSGQVYGLSDQNLPLSQLPHGHKIGQDIRWHTPLKGLMVGMSHETLSEFINAEYLGKIPGYGGQKYDNIWDYYGDYGWHRLKLAAEYQGEQRAFTIVLGGKGQPQRATDLRSMFASATWRFTPWFQVGAYRSEFYYVGSAVPGLIPGAAAHTFDSDVTARFDFMKHYTFKAEGHFMNGVASPLSSHGFYLFDNPQGLVNKTNLLVLKLGFNI